MIMLRLLFSLVVVLGLLAVISVMASRVCPPTETQVLPTLGYTISPKDTVIVLSPHLRLRVTFAQ